MFKDVLRTPGAPQAHRWADWAEIFLLTSPEGEISVPDLAEAVEGQADYLATEGNSDPDAGPRETEELSELAKRVNEDDLAKGEFLDAIRKRSFDVFDYLRSRQLRYGEAYPFHVDEESNIAALRERTDERDMYLFLLACAALRYVRSSDSPETSELQLSGTLTATFEIVSQKVMSTLLPANAVFRNFGSNAMLPKSYPGNLREQVSRLAEELSESNVTDEDDYETGDHGDGGLDIVAWLPFGDDLSARYIYFGQAACTPLWVNKQHSSSRSAWHNTIHFTATPTNTVFIPYDYRRPQSKWYSKRRIHDSVVIDRQRIMYALGVFDGTMAPILDIVDSVILDELGRARNSQLLEI